MPKSQAIIELADDIAQQINPDSIGFVESQSQGRCNTCPNSATAFKDALSAREYRISGMCQQCQDAFFDA